MARYYGPYRPGSSPVAIFSGPGIVAGNMAAEAGPRTQLGQVATVAGNMAAQVGPITRLNGALSTRLGVVGNVAGRMGAEAGPVTRLGSAQVTRLGVVANVAGRMGAEAGPVTRLGRLGAVRRTEGNYAAEVGPITRLNGPSVTRLGSPMVSSLGRPTAVQLGAARARFASFYGFGADESSTFSDEQIDCLASQGDDVSSDQALVNCGIVKEADASWTADQWKELITSIGGVVNPIVDKITGQLVNPRTGQPLSAQQVAAYRQYQSAQKKEGLPAWAVPAGIAAAVAVVVLLYMKKK